MCTHRLITVSENLTSEAVVDVTGTHGLPLKKELFISFVPDVYKFNSFGIVKLPVLFAVVKFY
jgi:hypothetical protein